MGLLKNDGAGNFTNTNITSALSSDIGNVTSILTGDFNGDGKLDAIIASATSGKLLWLENTGPDGDGSSWAEHMISTGYGAGIAVSTGDFNQDGALDIVTSSSANSTVHWWSNDSQGNFTQHTVGTTNTPTTSLTAGSLTNDNTIDVVGVSNGVNIDLFSNPDQNHSS